MRVPLFEDTTLNARERWACGLLPLAIRRDELIQSRNRNSNIEDLANKWSVWDASETRPLDRRSWAPLDIYNFESKLRIVCAAGNP
jgi:hypothetical protein